MKFRKKPVVVEAMQFHAGDVVLGDTIEKWGGNTVRAVGNRDNPEKEWRPICMSITTLEGIMTAMSGDWIIKGVKGEFYPCKPDIFDATYDAVSE